jgi:hypothetical protein
MPNPNYGLWQHAQAPRGLAYVPSSRSTEGRFGRLFRELPGATFSDKLVQALAQAMLSPAREIARGNLLDPQENPAIPAGYTYFGQFITHDLTFDPTSLLDRQNDPEGLVDFRTPRFDLDCLYGRGPVDQPYLYMPDGRLNVGESVSDRKQYAGPDLPRASNGRAIIADPRNDENKIVSQLHSLFIRLHNWMLTRAGGDFAETQRLVRWHYQWLVLNDFLPLLVTRPVIDAILTRDRYTVGRTAAGAAIQADRFKPMFRHYLPVNDGFLPVEFSAAAFRCGHSMVRQSYLINDNVPAAGQNRVPLFVPGGRAFDDLRSFGPLPPEWGIQWGYFFPLRDDLALPQPSYLIDEHLSNPLGALPNPVVADPPPSLAQRTLSRGVALGLPSGQDVARLMGITPLDDQQLFDDPGLRAAFRASAPLWYYILREANVIARGAHLGPVGSTIVAEVVIGLMWNDAQSYLRRDPNWQPEVGRRTMAGLIHTIGAPI